jgi:endoglucanase Acf2
MRGQLLKLLQSRVESWFSGESGKTYFHLDRTLGTVVGYPEEYFSVEQMNDHHFHYGYWIRAVAEIALRDPAWAAKDRWGGMVDLLVADIATTRRGGSDFPFLRNFDPYEGHSWASGIGMGAHGNNQESSSEAVNAWVGLILWGEVTGNRELRDLGVWMYATETDAIRHYWFDLHGLVFAPEYRAKSAEVSMLFGGKYAHNTWWTDEPRQIKGINLLPITTASTYMGQDPAFIVRSLGTLDAEVETFRSRGKGYGNVPKDIWQDIFAKYLALADPARALQAWDRWGSFELGDTRSHTLHWLLSLDAMGPPDLGVTADTPLYSVFRRADGRRTYLAFNPGKEPITVRFSDGKVLAVAPGALARAP